MKSMHAHELYSKKIQKTLDQDMQDLHEYEAAQYDRRDNRKIQPAYMQEDMFEQERREAEFRRQQQVMEDRRGWRGEYL